MQIRQSRISTDDFDEFCDWNQANGIEIRERRLQGGRGRFQSAFAVLGDCIVWRYCDSRRIFTEFAIPDDKIELLFGQCPEQPVFCGRSIAPSSVAVYRGGQSLEGVIPPGSEFYGIVVPLRYIESGNLFSESVANRILSGAHTINPIPSCDLKILFARLNSLLDNHRSLSAAESQLESILRRSDRAIGDIQWGSEPVRSSRRKKIIDAARQMIFDRLRSPLTVDDLLEELGVSRRTLELAFQNYLGVSPYQYIILEKLHASRQMLRHNRQTVLKTCLECGFADASRFAQMYQRQFDELPSQTKMCRKLDA